MRKTIQEATRMALEIAGGIVLAPVCVASVFGVCCVGLAFGEQNFNGEIKFGKTEERSERE